MILTKIWDDTFLTFWKCCLNDVITAFLMFYDGALSHLHFLCNFLQIDICCSSTHGFVWDCNPAFSVHIFYPKWRLEKQLKILKKSKWRKITNKICNLIDFDPLNTNMCMVCWFDRYLSCYGRLKFWRVRNNEESPGISNSLWQIYMTLRTRSIKPSSKSTSKSTIRRWVYGRVG